MNTATNNKQKGFSLIELLVTTAIIGLLVSIAIPEFKTYRTRAYNAMAMSDTRNAIVALTAYEADNNSLFPDSSDDLCSSATCLNQIPGLTLSKDVSVSILTTPYMTEGGRSFTGCHLKGNSYYVYSTYDAHPDKGKLKSFSLGKAPYPAFNWESPQKCTQGYYVNGDAS